MYRMPRRLVSLIVYIALAGLAGAQPRVDAAELLEGWIAQQRQALRMVDRLRLVESITREVDSPFKQRSIHIEQVLTLRERHLSRDLVSASIDRENVNSERLRHVEERLERALGSDWSEAQRLADAPAYFLGQMRPAAALERDRVNGAIVWRMDLGPAVGGTDAAIDRATLWFERNGPRAVLVQSHVVLRSTDEANAASIRTHYAAVRGPAGPLAVPRSQAVQARLQQKRRWRTFTVMVRSEREASDIQVTWKNSQRR